jgi:transposase
MPALKKYPPELKDRAVRLVLDARNDAGGRRGACTRIGQQLGIPSDTLRGWVQRAEIDQGLRPWATAAGRAGDRDRFDKAQ